MKKDRIEELEKLQNILGHNLELKDLKRRLELNLEYKKYFTHTLKKVVPQEVHYAINNDRQSIRRREGKPASNKNKILAIAGTAGTASIVTITSMLGVVINQNNKIQNTTNSTNKTVIENNDLLKNPKFSNLLNTINNLGDFNKDEFDKLATQWSQLRNELNVNFNEVKSLTTEEVAKVESVANILIAALDEKFTSLETSTNEKVEETKKELQVQVDAFVKKATSGVGFALAKYQELRTALDENNQKQLDKIDNNKKIISNSLNDINKQLLDIKIKNGEDKNSILNKIDSLNILKIQIRNLQNKVEGVDSLLEDTFGKIQYLENLTNTLRGELGIGRAQHILTQNMITKLKTDIEDSNMEVMEATQAEITALQAEITTLLNKLDNLVSIEKANEVLKTKLKEIGLELKQFKINYNKNTSKRILEKIRLERELEIALLPHNLKTLELKLEALNLPNMNGRKAPLLEAIKGLSEALLSKNKTSINNHNNWLIRQLRLEAQVIVDGKNGEITEAFRQIMLETIELVETSIRALISESTTTAVVENYTKP